MELVLHLTSAVANHNCTWEIRVKYPFAMALQVMIQEAALVMVRAYEEIRVLVNTRTLKRTVVCMPFARRVA